ncbi:Scarecrow-like protein 9 [Vitis vinifera]|uniref:Scarecrow-like protein 9 n=1 Tax=Vitis vinifera TaxID=29760 RepID=A0A438JX84_VITVI|nr:Scarecrow-like protein 9 [Vitis vinifera]
MIMDRSSSGLYGSMDRTGFNEDSVSVLPCQDLTNGGDKLQEPILDQNDIDILPISPHSSCNNLASWPDVEKDPHEDCDFGDAALKYVSQMLMEEDVEERNCMFQESLALEATEKLFYDIIREKYLPPDDHQTAPFIEENSGNPDQNGSIDFSTYSRNATSDGNCVELGRNFDVGEYKSPHVAPQPTCQSSFSSSSSAKRVPNIFNDSESVLQFRRGFEEASKFLPDDKVKKKHADEYFRDGWRRKKKSHPWDLESKEKRSSKQAAFYNGITVTSEMFDRVLLCGPEEDEDALRETWQNETTKTLQQNVAADDRTSANKQLRQIRQHASSMGDGMQRLAHYFANSLEARLSGSGAQMYKAITTKPSAANVLKIYHLLIVVSPYVKVTNFFSNKSIAEVAEKSERLHVIDFGILYGFSWPSLIQRLSSRPGGPPKLRITGIDLPEPGFRPAESLKRQGVDNDEVLAVRSRYRFGNLPDETVVAESPRDSVLTLIRQMNPDIFIHAIVNAACDTPFFMTRFREALFHYSALFDMLEENVPRNILERMLLEREVYGQEIMNIIACEGLERIERPETYKQWQVRNERIGFRQLPLDQEVVEEAKEWVKSCLHKDFIIDEDGQWLRLGWKGRITHAMSSWKPAC